MNVFVLCTGRCASMTFSMACRHLVNFTVGHETQAGLLGSARVEFPDDHIEVDNRLTWFLGRLAKRYGKDAFYVHLKRDRLKAAESFLRRYDDGVMAAWRRHIHMGLHEDADPLVVCLDYVDAVTACIEHFLRDKQWLEVNVETIADDFPRFWRWISGTGNLGAAMDEWRHRYNATEGRCPN